MKRYTKGCYKVEAELIILINGNYMNKGIDTLTKKELEILHLLKKGFLYKEIATKLEISINTIKKHIKNIYFKLDVRNGMEAVASLK